MGLVIQEAKNIRIIRIPDDQIFIEFQSQVPDKYIHVIEMWFNEGHLYVSCLIPFVDYSMHAHKPASDFFYAVSWEIRKGQQTIYPGEEILAVTHSRSVPFILVRKVL